RIYYFQAGGQEKVFIASADWMPRNMDRRIEILCPVEKPESKDRLLHGVLGVMLADNVKRRRMLPSGRYECLTPKKGEPVIRCQEEFIRAAREGGIKSMPYEIALRHTPTRKKGRRPVAKKTRR